MTKDLINRITYHLSSGGLFNPELADYLAVRNLLMECREALAQPEPWKKFCDSNCVWTDHHPDCKLAEQEPAGHGGRPMTLRECMEAEEPEKKPMASVHIKDGRLVGSHRDESKPFLDGQYGLWPIESPPPQRKPLTEEEIENIANSNLCIYSFARAIEAAHGIGE